MKYFQKYDIIFHGKYGYFMEKKKKSNLLILFFILVAVVSYFAFSNWNIIIEKSLLIYANIKLESKDYKNAYKIYNSLNQYHPQDKEIKDKMTICLCKMPLAYSVQKKLLEIAQEDDGSDAEKRATSILIKFRKKILNKYGDNYTKEILFNNMVLRWGKSKPITYYIKGDFETPEYYTSIAKDVFRDWQRESDNFLKFKEVFNEAGAKIVIKFHGAPDSSEISEDIGYQAGVTKPIIEREKFLKLMKIDILNKTHEKEFFTKEQIKTLITHEVGHALGLCGHTKDNKTIMYYSLDNDYDLYQNRIDTSLTRTDINTIKLLYALAPDICDDTNEFEEREKYIYHKAIFDALDNSKDAAVEEAAELIKANPGNIAYSLSLADAYTADGKYQESINIMLLLANNSTDRTLLNILYYNLANNYILLKDFENALIYAKKAQKISNNADNNCLIAYVEFLKGDIDTAEMSFRKILSKYPANTNASLGLADVYIRKKQYLEARKVLKELVKQKPDIVNDKIFVRYKIFVII